MLDEFLSKFGIPFEKLEEEERKTLMGWLENLARQQITLKDIEDHIRVMADGVARELCKSELPKKEDIFLKYQLRILIVLFLLVGE